MREVSAGDYVSLETHITTDVSYQTRFARRMSTLALRSWA